MKTARLFAYAALGVIGGLLLENKGLKLRDSVRKQAGKLKKATGEKLSDAAVSLKKAVGH